MAFPALTSDHERNTSNTMSERHAQHSHLTMIGTKPVMSERPSTHIWQPMSERLITYIRPCEEPIPHAERALHLHLTTNVRKAQHLHSTMWGTNPPCWKGSALTSDNQCQKGSALTFDHVMNWSSMQKGSTLAYDHYRNQSYNCLKMARHLHPMTVGTNPTFTSEWLCTYILSL